MISNFHSSTREVPASNTIFSTTYKESGHKTKDPHLKCTLVHAVHKKSHKTIFIDQSDNDFVKKDIVWGKESIFRLTNLH